MKNLSTSARVPLLAAMIVTTAACTQQADTASSAVQRLVDREQIETTLQRYLHGLDRLDAELYASSFAPDGEMIISGDRRQGRDGMRAVVAAEAKLRESMKARGEPPRTLFHFETQSRIEFASPDRALHSAYWLTVSRTSDSPGGMSILAVGTSTDELRKIGGEWLITRREITLEP
jgi:hypothetical protein